MQFIEFKLYSIYVITFMKDRVDNMFIKKRYFLKNNLSSCFHVKKKIHLNNY